MGEVGLLPFARIALQVCRAGLPGYRSGFSKHQIIQPQLLAILGLMRYEDWTFREAEVQLGEHRELRQALGLVSVPDFTTLYRFLHRREEGIIDCAVGETVRRLHGTHRKGRRYAGCAVRTEKDDGEPAQRWMQWAWRRERSGHSLCGECIIAGKNRCRGDIG